MDQKWLLILVIVVSCQKFTPGAAKDQIAKEGQRVEIYCKPEHTAGASMIVWFRVLSNFRMEFIGSFSTSGIPKTVTANFNELYTYANDRLILRSFKKTDTGQYGCATLYQGTKMDFGDVTQISAEKTVGKTEAPPTCTTKPSVPKITTCACEGKKGGEGEYSSAITCSPIMLGALASGCGLFLLLLIITILYCNRIRTRRCPHHHKRRPRTAPPAKEAMPGRYV